MLANLFRKPLGAPMPPEALNELLTALTRRCGLDRKVTPHMLRHAFAGNILDAGGSVDELQSLLGHATLASTRPYLHPAAARLRAAVERVSRPRDDR
ncbi:tyrosine-type recombinase/integrase [Nonomuraea sp. CA-143628]|uniref:tyrosine-type recombinase/integrase n=1 Tax=Nonomuraea sp. CA-143628 TaxID=3239997 RepID=UPI003D8E5B1D